MLEGLAGTIIQLIHTTGYAGVFLLMTLESALIPIPSEVTMPFAGSLVASGLFNFWVLVIVGALANLTGSLLAYALGYLGEDTVLAFIRKYGKYVLIREKEFHHATELFDKHGDAIVFISRMLPAIRTYISLPAGIARMDLKKFVIYTTVGSLVWSAVLAYLGVILGKNWQILSTYFRKFDILIVGVIIIGISFYIYRHLKAR